MTHRSLNQVFSCIAALAVTGSALSAQRAPEQFRDLVAVDAPVVALTNVTVIDGTGAPARTGQTLSLIHI